MISTQDIVDAFTLKLKDNYAFYRKVILEKKGKKEIDSDEENKLEMLKKLNEISFSNKNISQYLDCICRFFNKLEERDIYFSVLKYTNDWTNVTEVLEQNRLYVIYDEESIFKDELRYNAYLLETNDAQEMLKLFAGDSLIFNELNFFNANIYTSPEVNDLWMEINTINQKIEKPLFFCEFENLKSNAGNLKEENFKVLFKQLSEIIVPDAIGCEDYNYSGKISQYIKENLFNNESFEQKFNFLKIFKNENLCFKDIYQYLNIEDKIEILKEIEKNNIDTINSIFSQRIGLSQVISNSIVFGCWKDLGIKHLDISLMKEDGYTYISSPFMQQIICFFLFDRNNKSVVNKSMFELLMDKEEKHDMQWEFYAPYKQENLLTLKFETHKFPEIDQSNFIPLLELSMKHLDVDLEESYEEGKNINLLGCFSEHMSRFSRELYLNKQLNKVEKISKIRNKI